jgi:hypothetical protein
VAEDAGQGTLTDGAGTAPVVSSSAHVGEEHNPGRPISWIGVAIVTVGFVVGGVAMIPGMRWWQFWLGVGIAVVGCLILAVARTFDTDWY